MKMIISDKWATRDHAKLHDKQVIFASIYHNEQISRAKIARLTNSPFSGADR